MQCNQPAGALLPNICKSCRHSCVLRIRWNPEPEFFLALHLRSKGTAKRVSRSQNSGPGLSHQASLFIDWLAEHKLAEDGRVIDQCICFSLYFFLLLSTVVSGVHGLIALALLSLLASPYTSPKVWQHSGDVGTTGKSKLVFYSATKEKDLAAKRICTICKNELLQDTPSFNRFSMHIISE